MKTSMIKVISLFGAASALALSVGCVTPNESTDLDEEDDIALDDGDEDVAETDDALCGEVLVDCGCPCGYGGYGYGFGGVGYGGIGGYGYGGAGYGYGGIGYGGVGYGGVGYGAVGYGAVGYGAVGYGGVGYGGVGYGAVGCGGCGQVVAAGCGC